MTAETIKNQDLVENLIIDIRNRATELFGRLPPPDNNLPTALVIEQLGRFVDWIPRMHASLLEEHAKMLVLVENRLREEVLHIQLQLGIRGDRFKKIILDLVFSEREPVFTAYEDNSYVVAPPRERQKGTASLPIIEAFSRFLTEAFRVNSGPVITS